MQKYQDIVTFFDDFVGRFVALNYQTIDTSPSGTPTSRSNFTPNSVGQVELSLDATDEAQAIGNYFIDRFSIDIDQVKMCEYRVKCSTPLNANTTITFGLCDTYNIDTDIIANSVFFKLKGNNTVLVETDDGFRDNSVATNKTLGNSYQTFTIDFTGGKSNVKFYIAGNRVLADRTFDMSNYSGSLQSLVLLQKSSGTGIDTLDWDYIRIESNRV